jgi:hypothetical protein
MVGRSRPERFFSMGHTGGDLSLPEEVKRRVLPSPFPIFDELSKLPESKPANLLDPRREAG